MKNVKLHNPGITVELVGGLGNQLFIYATGYALSQKMNCPLYVDTTWFRTQTDRHIELNSFVNDAILTSTRPLFRKAEIQIQKFAAPLTSKKTNVYVESGMEYHLAVSQLEIGSRIRGYFQSWKYFEEEAPEIRSHIRDLVHPSAWYRASHVEFNNQEEWIAVHVRRGDYLKAETRSVHGVLGDSYYKNALKQMDAHFGDALPLKVFSDDHSATRTLFERSNRKIEFVQEPLGSDPIESMLLMSQGAGVITANSSFSWWAAWLGEGVTRPVCVPNPWFRTKSFNLNDLFLQNWKSLDGQLC